MSFEYVKNHVDTVHIAPAYPGAHTLCGLSTRDMTIEDETLSGFAATCLTCKKNIKRKATTS